MLQDLHRNLAYSGDSSHMKSKIRCFVTLRFQAVFLFRLSQLLGSKVGLLGFLVKQLNQAITGADVSWQATIGPGLVLFHPNGVVIGSDCAIGQNASIQQGVTIGGYGGVERQGSSPYIGDNVSFGSGSKIIGKIRVGDGAKIGANAVVIRDVPANATAVGVPARVLTKKP